MSEELSPSPTTVFVFAGIAVVIIMSALVYGLFPTMSYWAILLVIVLAIIVGIVVAKITGS